ncbi:MAG: ATP-binding protein [Deltaproteobacteria bacterium]|jgi:Cdc6-like AAA superfamily ATPase|nr:ATP-binding protein [Deltaproteobacteria bacterium]
MTQDSWLPKGAFSDNGFVVRSLLEKGPNWQIFDSPLDQKILVADKKIGRHWLDLKLLKEDQGRRFQFLDQDYYCWESPPGMQIFQVLAHPGPSSYSQALALARALKASRRIDPVSSFQGAVFIEEYSRLLPPLEHSDPLPDSIFLGSFLTGGVRIPAGNFSRLSQLTGWLLPEQLAEIIRTAGLEEPRPEDLAAAAKPAPKLPLPKAGRNPLDFSLPGRPELETFFRELILDIIFNLERYQALGLDFPAPLVLYGPPGCGKTHAVEKLVNFLGWPLFTVDSGSIGSPYIHQTGRMISEIFDKAVKEAPSVIVIDEMEAFLTSRTGQTGSSTSHLEEVAEFLRLIPEAPKNRVLLAAMTNALDLVDPAVLRRGRFDHLIEVGPPTRPEVVALLASLMEKLPCDPDLELDWLISSLTGKPLSDAAFVIREAARITARDGKERLDTGSLKAAVKLLPENPKSKLRPIGFAKG